MRTKKKPRFRGVHTAVPNKCTRYRAQCCPPVAAHPACPESPPTPLSSYRDRGQCGSPALPLLVPHTYFKVSRSFLILPMPSRPALLYFFPYLFSLSTHHTYSYSKKFSLALSLSPLSFPSSFLSRLSAPLPTTTHHFPHLTKSCSPWSPSSASFLTPAVSNSLDHPFLRILASLAQQSGEASAQQQGPSDHFLASSLSMDCRGTEAKGLLLQQSQQPRTPESALGWKEG